MDATTEYDIALFLHIGGVLALFAAMTIEGIALRGLRHAITGDEARTWLGLLRPTRLIGPAALVLILLPGLYLAADISVGGGWIAIGLLGFLAIAIIGGAVTGRRMSVVGPVLGRAQGPLSDDLLRLAGDRALAASYAVRLAIAIGIVWLMTLKPDPRPVCSPCWSSPLPSGLQAWLGCRSLGPGRDSRAVPPAAPNCAVKIGLHIPATSWQGGPATLGSTLEQIVEVAEAVGFDSIDVADHLWQHPRLGGPTENQIEAYTTLGFIAARTRRVRLFTLATAASYRPAGLLAKMVTTLDVLSGGRAMLGIGAGDYPEEAEGLGLSFPALGERFDVLDETLQACLRMWAGDRGDERPFRGEHVRLGHPLNAPQSLSRPHPPILIAGRGEHRTLPLVARYGMTPATPPPSPDIFHASSTFCGRLCDRRTPRLRPDREDRAVRLRHRRGRVEGGRRRRPARLAGGAGHSDGVGLGRRRRSNRAPRNHGPRRDPRPSQHSERRQEAPAHPRSVRPNAHAALDRP